VDYTLNAVFKSYPGIENGAALDNDGRFLRGAVFILFLNRDGTVKAYQKISDNQVNFTGNLRSGDLFGFSWVHRLIVPIIEQTEPRLLTQAAGRKDNAWYRIWL
jgi:hypothetical protein